MINDKLSDLQGLCEKAKFRRRSASVTAWQWQGQPQAEWPAWLNGLEPMLVNDSLDHGWWFIDQSPYRARAITAKEFAEDYEPDTLAGKEAEIAELKQQAEVLGGRNVVLRLERDALQSRLAHSASRSKI